MAPLKDWEAVTKARRLDMLERVVFAKIGALPVKQITPAHILDLLRTICLSSKRQPTPYERSAVPNRQSWTSHQTSED
jgi:hypothetical protein